MEIKQKAYSKRVLYFEVECYCPHCGKSLKLKIREGTDYDTIGKCECGSLIRSYLDNTYMTLTFEKEEDNEEFNLVAKSKHNKEPG